LPPAYGRVRQVDRPPSAWVLKGGPAPGAACPSVGHGLLEVVAEHLLDLWCRAGRRAVEPVREPLVQPGPIRAGDALIRRHPDQGVTEPEGVRACALEEAPLLHRLEVALQERTRLGGEEPGHGIRVELETHDRRGPEQVALA